MKKHIFGLMFFTALLFIALWNLEIILLAMNNQGIICWIVDCYKVSWANGWKGLFFYHMALYMIPVSVFGMCYCCYELGRRDI